jgi:hypothetical protein
MLSEARLTEISVRAGSPLARLWRGETGRRPPAAGLLLLPSKEGAESMRGTNADRQPGGSGRGRAVTPMRQPTRAHVNNRGEPCHG